MKDKIEKLLEFTKKNRLILLIIIIVIALFCWYEIRPVIAKKNCAQKMQNIGKDKGYSISEYDFAYNWCLHLKGI